MKRISLLALAAFVAACDRPVASTAPVETTAVAASASASASAAPTAPAATAPPTPTATSAAPPGSAKVGFAADPLGAASPAFEAVVGEWYVAQLGGVQGLKVDGSKWQRSTPSANLADKAKRLYGDRYAEFLDGVQAFAHYPLAVWKGDPPEGDMRLSVRFYPHAGQIDQGAGIAFSIAPDGSYLGARANALENNLLYFRVERGKRTVLDKVHVTAPGSKAWHELSLEIRSRHLELRLDGVKRFEKTLEAVPEGRVGSGRRPTPRCYSTTSRSSRYRPSNGLNAIPAPAPCS
jgi:hypothetical protein